MLMYETQKCLSNSISCKVSYYFALDFYHEDGEAVDVQPLKVSKYSQKQCFGRCSGSEIINYGSRSEINNYGFGSEINSYGSVSKIRNYGSGSEINNNGSGSLTNH